MKRSFFTSVCLIALFAAQPALAQSHGDEDAVVPETAPVAFVYVASNFSANTNRVVAFSAATNGKLTPIPGSPFKANVGSMAVNGKYLFGGSSSGTEIYSFLMAGNGALHPAEAINAEKYSGCSLAGSSVGSLFLDHSGATLYDLYDLSAFTCVNSFGGEYQSFMVEKPTGALSFLGGRDEFLWSGPLSFIGNNEFAYAATCDPYTSPPGAIVEIYGFQRHGDGLLTQLNISPPLPDTNERYVNYCPYLAAADPTNHVAFTLEPTMDGQLYYPLQLAVYTADDHGNLTTSSTSKNMPTTLIMNAFDLKMSPSGKLLAIGGMEGLQIFHFNGGEPITHYTNLLTKDPIDQFFWDNASHLYAISQNAGKLFVFTITPTSATQAPGSPYAIVSPQNVIVQPKTPRP